MEQAECMGGDEVAHEGGRQKNEDNEEAAVSEERGSVCTEGRRLAYLVHSVKRVKRA